MVIKEKEVIVRKESIMAKMKYHTWKGNNMFRKVTILIHKRFVIVYRKQIIISWSGNS